MAKVIVNQIMKILPLKNSHSNNGNNTDPARVLYSFADGKGTIGFIPSITGPSVAIVIELG